MKSILLKGLVVASAFLLFATSNAKAELRTSVTQYGITWNFSTAKECGQFVTGDWWVVGPVTITSVSPGPGGGRNGNTINPTPGCFQPYDSRTNNYDASKGVTFPRTVGTNSSVVSTISNGGSNCSYAAGIGGYMNVIGDCQRGLLKSMAVLTVVGSPVASGTFRPNYIGNTKYYYNVSQIDYNVLPNLPAPASLPNINRVLRLFERPWLDHFNCWITQFCHAIDNSEGYGREMSNDVSEAAGYLMTNGAQKQELVRRMVQRGIDIYGGMKNGATWPADGGHASGRKWPMLFAGKMLNDPGMLAGQGLFGEDLQTYYSGGQPWWRFAPGRETYRPQYRICCTSHTWVGQALTARMLHLDDNWGHDVYFQYVDRWINEGGSYGGNDGGTFIRSLWQSYRYNLPAEIPHNGGGPADTEAPSVPTNLTVTGTNLAGVSLSWTGSTDNVSVAGYRIYVNGAVSTSVSGTSTTVSGLNPGTTYSFKVSAYDPAGNESAQSSSVNGTTESGTIVSVSAATASGDDGNVAANTLDGDLNTRWSSLGDGEWVSYQLGGATNLTAIGIAFYSGTSRVSDFDIQVSSNGTSWTTVLSGAQSSGTTNDVEIFDFTNTTASYIRYLGHGNSVNEWNSLTEVKIYASGSSDTQAPNTPTNLSASNVTASSVDLSWTASTDNVGVATYRIYANGNNVADATTTSATVTGLLDNTLYTFSVSAVDAAGNESSQSSSVNATTDEITGVISSSSWQSFTESTQTGVFTTNFDAIPNGSNIDAVTGILNGTASGYGDLACIIRFNSSGNIDARNGGTYTATNTVSYSSGVSYHFRVEVDVTSHVYSVYVTPQGGSEQTVASNFAFRTEQASVTALTGWAVYAYIGNHTVDNMTFTVDSDTQLPSVPGTPTASNITHNSVGLSWTASTDNVGVTGYKVYTNGANPVGVTGTSIAINDLSPATQYSFTVSAVDGANNESAQSSPRVVTTEILDVQAPSVPTGLAVGTTTSSSVALSWNASSDNVGVTGYKVYTDGSNPVTVSNTSATITGLAPSTTYAFTVSAVDAAGTESAQSSSVNGTTDAAAGVTSSGSWQSFTVSTETGEFTATFDAVPNGNNIDAVTGILNGSASGYGDLACIIRFNSSGNIDARNGGSYAASNTVSYSSGTTYSFRVEINVSSHTYSVYVTPNGGSEQTVASNFAFRTEQASVTQLTGWSIYAYVGSHTVSNVVFDNGSQGGGEGINIISNGEFDSGTTDWVAGNYGGTSALSAVTGQGMSGDNALQVSISAAGTNPWDIQIYQDIEITSGKTYEISFQGKAASSRDIDVVIQNTESPYQEYWHQDISLTTSTQSFGPYTFNSSITDATCRFKLFVGGSASAVYVDEIVVSDLTESSAEVVEIAKVVNEPSLNVYPNPLNSNTLNVAITGYNSDVVKVVIFDLMGRSVYNNAHSIIDNITLAIPAERLNKGMYVISVQGQDVVKQQTIVVVK